MVSHKNIAKDKEPAAKLEKPAPSADKKKEKVSPPETDEKPKPFFLSPEFLITEEEEATSQKLSSGTVQKIIRRLQEFQKQVEKQFESMEIQANPKESRDVSGPQQRVHTQEAKMDGNKENLPKDGEAVSLDVIDSFLFTARKKVQE
ncbi:MAG: hypothetical protein GWM98_16215 [Nitrospinaceae bacterium]|nr:hypothetical protein [Nitrospinaceae bacterium]NIR55747.1 hypothetical protein [Nitrospinaceae bacterium]NIS86188.1 hypothetical protein [Nitrospinaceae bacterium]NIT83026.1 hypothetical protein [Nitrospinaceae bacterium]NIU45239.1 hypothetical protein [Nitrospinaceae bacterium]